MEGPRVLTREDASLEDVDFRFDVRVLRWGSSEANAEGAIRRLAIYARVGPIYPVDLSQRFESRCVVASVLQLRHTLHDERVMNFVELRDQHSLDVLNAFELESLLAQVYHNLVNLRDAKPVRDVVS